MLVAGHRRSAGGCARSRRRRVPATVSLWQNSFEPSRALARVPRHRRASEGRCGRANEPRAAQLRDTDAHAFRPCHPAREHQLPPRADTARADGVEQAEVQQYAGRKFHVSVSAGHYSRASAPKRTSSMCTATLQMRRKWLWTTPTTSAPMAGPSRRPRRATFTGCIVQRLDVSMMVHVHSRCASLSITCAPYPVVRYDRWE